MRSRGVDGKREQTMYFPEEVACEITREAERQGRSLSWMAQWAWRYSKEKLRRFGECSQARGAM